MDEIGGWPLLEDDWYVDGFNVWQKIIQLYKLGFVGDDLPIIKIDIMQDKYDESKRSIHITPPTLGLPLLFLKNGTDNNLVQKYFKYVCIISNYRSREPKIDKFHFLFIQPILRLCYMVQPSTASTAKIQIHFSRQGDLRFLAGFIE